MIIWLMCRIMFGNPKNNYGSFNYEFEFNEKDDEKFKANINVNNESIEQIQKQINSDENLHLNLPGIN